MIGKTGDSGRQSRSNLPTARPLDAPQEPDDFESVLFGPVLPGSNENLLLRRPESRRSKMSQVKLPKWGLYLIAAVAILSTVLVILISMDHSGSTPTSQSNSPTTSTSLSAPYSPSGSKPRQP
jgi:hypothetical protein